MRREDLRQELATHLVNALQVRREEAEVLLWEPPRALLTAVVPTCIRRLRSEWQSIGTDPFARPGQLLPEFVTASLFSPLNVPEVTFELPFGKGGQEAMQISAALREAVPGRVSRRFGHRDQQHRTWIAPPPPDSTELDLSGFVQVGEPVGRWRTRQGAEVEVYRPTVISLAQPSREVDTSSQGTPRWDTEILPPASRLTPASLPAGGFARHVTDIGFATHAYGNPARVRRMTTGADLETRTSGQRRRELKSSISYTFAGRPAALGFELTVDALCVEIGDLDLTAPRVGAHLATPAWKHAAFVAVLAAAPALDGRANYFQRSWLTRVYLTCFAVTSLENPQLSPEQIRLQLAGGAWRTRLGDVLNALYRDSNTAASATVGPTIEGLTQLAETTQVTDCIDGCATILTGAAPDAIAQRAHRETLAAGLLAAVQRYVPNSQDHDLTVDIEDLDGGARIWLTETAMGGLGVIERFGRRYADDPRRFWSAVGSVLGPSEYEYVDHSLTQLLGAAAADPGGEAAEGIKRVRDATDTTSARRALERLRRIWAGLSGGNPQPSAVKALNVRLLRPGTGAESDEFAYNTVSAWQALETHLGFEVEASVIAYAVHTGLLPPGRPRRITADQAYSMLWPRGAEARNTHLHHYQPYARQPLLDRLLAQAAHQDAAARIDVAQPGWVDEYRETLAKEGSAELTAPDHAREHLAQALRQVPAIAIEHDVLRIYGTLRRVTYDGGLLCARIELKQVLS